MPKIVLNSVEDYERATQEVQELTGAPEGSPEEARMVELILAIEVWDLAHDDATRWER